nr:hypothetical protein [Mesorhizobium sp.]
MKTLTAGESLDIEVGSGLAPYVEATALRLGYAEQLFSVQTDGSRFRVTARAPFDREAIERRIAHALYREKIRVESAPLRARFLELLSQR